MIYLLVVDRVNLRRSGNLASVLKTYFFKMVIPFFGSNCCKGTTPQDIALYYGNVGKSLEIEVA